jgi:glyoxylase-like metal-dependent hydrolase (beta-lactamase superfamily II)
MTPVATHFNALTMCPYGGWLAGAKPFERARMVCHCLVVETSHGLVLVETGLFATADLARPRAPLGYRRFLRVEPTLEGTAKYQLEALGHRASDVRHVLCTHLDLDHAGGLSDFPHAQVHVMAAERDAAQRRATAIERRRYLAAHFAHGPKWREHRPSDGERWKGFDCVRALADDDPDVLLVPLAGHTRGHAAVAVRTARGWLLHCGDAYLHRDEMTGRGPWGLSLFERGNAFDHHACLDNQRRLRHLSETEQDVRVFCSHSPDELASFTQGDGS